MTETTAIRPIAPSPLDHTRDVVGTELDRCATFMPPIPEILAKLEKELSSEWMNVSRLANMVRTDPALAGSVLKVANSPLWRGSRQITEVEEAIQRIGKDNLRSLATVLALNQGKLPSTGLFGASMKSFWRHSLLVAAGSVQMMRSQNTNHEVLDMVWTAALLHDMGALLAPLLYPSQWEKASLKVAGLDPVGEVVNLALIFRETLGIDHARIAGVFAERGWKMSQTVAVLAGYWPDPALVEPSFAAWTIHRADQAAQTMGVCWQPQATRARTLEVLPEESGAGPACDPEFCLASLSKHLPLVDALLSF